MGGFATLAGFLSPHRPSRSASRGRGRTWGGEWIQDCEHTRPAHAESARELCLEEGPCERWTKPADYAIERTETAETLKGISMQLGHDWYDIRFSFGPDGRLDRLNTKCKGMCKCD